LCAWLVPCCSSGIAARAIPHADPGTEGEGLRTALHLIGMLGMELSSPNPKRLPLLLAGTAVSRRFVEMATLVVVAVSGEQTGTSPALHGDQADAKSS